MIKADDMTAADVVRFVRNKNVSEDAAIEMVEMWKNMRAAQRVANSMRELLEGQK